MRLEPGFWPTAAKAAVTDGEEEEEEENKALDGLRQKILPFSSYQLKRGVVLTYERITPRGEDACSRRKWRF